MIVQLNHLIGGERPEARVMKAAEIFGRHAVVAQFHQPGCRRTQSVLLQIAYELRIDAVIPQLDDLVHWDVVPSLLQIFDESRRHPVIAQFDVACARKLR